MPEQPTMFVTLACKWHNYCVIEIYPVTNIICRLKIRSSYIGAVVHLGFHEGPFFSLANNAFTREAKPCFSSFFSMIKADFFTGQRGPWPMPSPKYATIQETGNKIFYHAIYLSIKSSCFAIEILKTQRIIGISLGFRTIGECLHFHFSVI